MKKSTIVILVILGVTLLVPVGLFLIVFLASIGLLKMIFQQVIVLIGFVYWPFRFYVEYFKAKIKALKNGNNTCYNCSNIRLVQHKKTG
jgi:hypothetical protein